MARLPSFYTLSLLAGAVLVGSAGARHPLLEGDGATQLATIAAAASWRGIHLSLVFGVMLVVAGLAGVALQHGETAGSAAARAGILLAVLGYGTMLVGVLVMTGSATKLAATFAAARPGLAATDAVFVYDMIRPFAAMALRSGEFAIGLSTWALGWAVWDGRIFPRWLGMFGVVAGVTCTLWAVVLPEEAALLMGGLVLVTLWQAGTAGVSVLQEWSRQGQGG
jgi:hypothetical protein